MSRENNTFFIFRHLEISPSFLYNKKMDLNKLKKTKQSFFCDNCGEVFSKWQGKCSACEEWNTIKIFRETSPSLSIAVSGTNLLTPNFSPKKSASMLLPTAKKNSRIFLELEELNLVLGGGIMRGSYTLLGGKPGIGKSTLALQIFLSSKNAFYFSGEESLEQITERAFRINKDALQKCHCHIFATESLEDICATLENSKADMVIIDSIQMISARDTKFNSVLSIRENAETLHKIAKKLNIAIIIIGHVTKTNEIAGPKILEHIVDTVLSFEDNGEDSLRILRATKNRFGSTEEIAVLKMTGAGLQKISNPTEAFLKNREINNPGSSITIAKNGSRNFLIEIQSLAKLHLLLAVMSRFTPFNCENKDFYLSIMSGFSTSDTAVDLSILSSLMSSLSGKALAPDTIFLGEVGLCGEIRPIKSILSRLTAAQKLGFQTIYLPNQPLESPLKKSPKIQIKKVNTVGELYRELFRKK